MIYSNPQILSNLDIEYLSKRFDIKLNACVSKDMLRTIKPKSGGYVINLQDLADGNGSHWVALHLSRGCAIYFDSFGCVCPLDVLDFCNRYSRTFDIIHSETQIQDIKQECCGYYALYFLHWIQSKPRLKYNLDYYLNSFIRIFDINDFSKNDNILQEFFRQLWKTKK